MPKEKHVIYGWVAAAFLLTMALGGVAGAAEPAGPNLARNPGFEDGPRPWQLPEGFEVVKGVAHSGDASLHFVRTDAATYRLATQSIEFHSGRRYRFSAWIRTRGVKGGESGATICMEWGGAKGWIGGTYPEGRKGDNEWFRVVGITPPIPPEAKSVGVTLYLRKGTTGEAWFDDVEVVEFAGPPLEAWLAQPPYRGLLFDGEPRAPFGVRVDLAEIIEGHAWQAGGGYEGFGDLALVCRLVVGEKPVAEKRVDKFTSRTLDLELASAPLKVGDYTVEVVLKQGGRDVASQRLAGSVLPAGKRPRVYIDAHRRTVVDGKPFFPLGFYFGTLKEEDIEMMAEAGFNCAMPYAFSAMPLDKAGELLDMAQRHGVKVIYSVKDLYKNTKYAPGKGVNGFADPDAAVTAVVQRFRTHPNVLAWYLNDELPVTMRNDLEARYELVRRLDPDHPTWAVLFQVDELAEYRHTCDVLGTDPYPLPQKPVAMAGEWARKTSRAGAAAVWQVPQAFDWATYHKDENPSKYRPPTYEEIRVMTYQALIGGAKGLIYYSFFDLQRDHLGFQTRWKDLARIGGEMLDLMPALLAADPPPPEVSVSGPEWTVRRDGNRVWVLVANPEPKPVTMRLAVPRGAVAVRTASGRQVPCGEPAAGGPPTVTQELKPLECETFVIELR